MSYWEMVKAISPFDYTKRNKLTNHTELCGEKMAWVNYYANYCKNIYDGYAANRENIKNPDILNFMKDYEEYYITKEKEKEKEECKKK